MITKNQIIASSVPLNANVKDEKIDPYIPVALLQLKSILPATLYAALQALFEEEVKDWSKTNSYVADDKVTHIEFAELKMWESLTTNSNEEPATTNTVNWDELELGTFLVGHVQPFLAHEVFYAYAVNGGINPSHQGLQQVTNETAQPVTGNALQAYLNYWKKQANLIRKMMFTYLDEKNNTLDGVTYDSVDLDKKKPRFQIRAIGGKKRVIRNSSIET